MDYLKTNLKWEDFFIKESVELGEKMSGFDIEDLSKSKIRLSLENKILDWDKYESWVVENLGCASLKKDVLPSILNDFLTNSREAHNIYSNYDFWSEDLLPILMWESQLIVFGIHFNENLLKIQNHVFILAPPDILSFFAKNIFNPDISLEQTSEHTEDHSYSQIEGLQPDIQPPSLVFKDISINTVSNFKPIENEKPKELNENSIWDFIDERHEEYIFEVKKQFSAYIVLKIEYDFTRVYKMDPDLEKDNINHKLFSYSIKEENPFKRVYESGNFESFSLSQLGLNLKNYKYACITALKSGDKVVGFLVGFKNINLSDIDQLLLEELAKESAA